MYILHKLLTPLNKNMYMFGFLYSLVQLDIFEEVYMSFLLVGHTGNSGILIYFSCLIVNENKNGVYFIYMTNIGHLRFKYSFFRWPEGPALDVGYITESLTHSQPHNTLGASYLNV